MSKVIAVIDKPKDCRHCYFLVGTSGKNEYFCSIKHSRILIKDIPKERFKRDEEIHLKDCPLREVPQKPDYPPINEQSYVAGWNACIDEIMKGVEAE